MTEEKWLTTTDFGHMGNHTIRVGIHTDRKFRHFVIARCRRVVHLCQDSRSHKALALAEVQADITYGTKKFTTQQAAARRLHRLMYSGEDVFPPETPHDHAARAIKFLLLMVAYKTGDDLVGCGISAISRAKNAFCRSCTADAVKSGEHAWDEATAHIYRDLFGNPFRPVAFAPGWRSPDAVGLAEAVYAGKAFDRLPILADALEEAGCDDADVLAHLRGDGPHVRGCWALDLVLGKA